MNRISLGSMSCLLIALFLAGCADDPTAPTVTEPFLAYLSGPNPTFDGIWRAPTGELYMCGAEGTMLQQQGKGWRKLATGVRFWLKDLHGISTDYIFAVGTEGHVLHFDGDEWRLQYSDTRELLHDVWVAPDSSAVAVGDEATLIQHDQDGWRAVDLAVRSYLAGVWGSGPDDIFVVGSGGTILHYDGAEWREQASGTAANLNAVWGTGADDVWAIGSDGVILHYDGENWSLLESKAENQYHDIAGDSDGTIVIAGLNGVCRTRRSGIWSTYTHPSGLDLKAAGLTADGRPLTAGCDGLLMEATGVDAFTWNTIWQGDATKIYSVWYGDASHIYALGRQISYWDYGNASWGSPCFAPPGASIHCFDGSRWTTLIDNPSVVLNEMWGASPTEVFVVGSGGTIYLCDGQQAELMDSGTNRSLTGVWGRSNQDVYVSGDEILLHYDGTAWSPIDTPATGYWVDVWCDDNEAVFLTGNVGDYVVLSRTGTGDWVTAMLPGGIHPFAIWGSSAGDVFVVGFRTKTAHWDGENWSLSPAGTEYTLHDVWGFAADDVYACGNWGTLVHYDGESWNPIDPGMRLHIYGLHGTGHGVLYAGGLWNTVTRFNPGE